MTRSARVLGSHSWNSAAIASMGLSLTAVWASAIGGSRLTLGASAEVTAAYLLNANATAVFGLAMVLTAYRFLCGQRPAKCVRRSPVEPFPPQR